MPIILTECDIYMKVVRIPAWLSILHLAQAVYMAEAEHKEMFPADLQGAARWKKMRAVMLDLGFSPGSAHCSGLVLGTSASTSVSAAIALERKNADGSYTRIARWSMVSAGASLAFDNTYAVAAGYTYRLSVTADVTKNDVTEPMCASTESTY